MINRPAKPDTTSASGKPGAKTWLKRLGVAGFMFFFLKGLVWLAVFFGLGAWIGC